MNIEFTLNGKQQRTVAHEERSLLDVLREDLGLTGAKFGCGEGQCRACTVLLDGKPVPSCLTPIGTVAGHKIETIEGISQGQELHPVQRAFIEEGAMQCGYCVPGMILTSVALLRDKPLPTRDEAIAALNGNLCRCCGYPSILRAVERAAQASQPIAKP